MRKKKSKAWIIVLLIVMLLATLVGAYYLITDEKEKTAAAEAELADANLYIDENTIYLYVATEDIAKGDVLVDGVNVEVEECLTGLSEESYITEDDLGSTAVVDIEAYTPIFTNMVTPEKITNDLREVEIGIAQLPLNIKENDFVDIRIRFATGQDYIVASKLRVKSIDLENSIFYTSLNESEILTLASATVDAYTNTGTKMYLTTYEEANLQEDAEPNYPVKDEVYNLILQDPNIVEVAEGVLNQQARTQVRAYLGLVDEDYLDAVSSGDGLADTAHTSAMAAKQSELAEESDVEIEYEEGEEE